MAAEQQHAIHHKPLTNLKGKTMNKDQVEGRVDQVKGKIKEIAGNVTGNEALKQEGVIDQVAGKTQATYGDVKENVKDTVKDAADKL